MCELKRPYQLARTWTGLHPASTEYKVCAMADWAIMLLEQVIARRCIKCSCFIIFYVCLFIALHSCVDIADTSNKNS